MSTYKIPVAKPALGEEELNNVIKAVKSGWVSSKGEFIEKFEKDFAKYIGVKYGVATSNGTTALHLALAALNIRRGDEVIVPDLTFIATANVVKHCGAKPVLVDVNSNYWCIDPKKIEEKITPKTRAIIPVHLYGHPCDMEYIIDIANKNDLFVVEDAAEAHGAEYKGNKVGSFGDVSCFSFYGNKIITTGEGGICLTNNEELAEKMRILRDHGQSLKKKYWHEMIGFNYRMTNIQAAIGLAQLKKIDEFIEKKRQIAKLYSDHFKELAERGMITLHPEMRWAKSVYWMYSILIEDRFGITRDNLIEKLEAEGIETRPFFYPIHKMPPYRKRKNNNNYRVSEELSRKGLNLPSSVLLTEEEIKTVTEAIKRERKHI